MNRLIRLGFTIVLLTVIALQTGCATTPEGVTYLEFGQESEEDKRVKGGLEETSPGSGENDIVLLVLNIRKEPAKFSLRMTDGERVRQIWKNERITQGKTLFEMATDDKDRGDYSDMAKVSRTAIVRVRGLHATINVNETEHELNLKPGRSRVWLVTLDGDKVGTTHFDMR